ncbi:MAG: SpaA isopeptide-forming pilin-related protein [Clostridia bacterium]
MRSINFLKANRKKVLIGLIAIILLIVMATISIFAKRNTKSTLSEGELAELAVAQTYDKVQEGDNDTQSSYVKFDAFVLKDLDGDGVAEKIRGTCKAIGEQDTLYMELSVNSEGTLKNPVIMINGKNFNLATSLVADNVIKENYISNDAKSISLNDIKDGTITLLQGEIVSGNYAYATSKASAIQNGNVNNYSIKDNTITLKGTYVDNNGEETEIVKTVNLAVDWHGKVGTSISGRYQKSNLYAGNSAIKFQVKTSETKKELMLSGLYVKGTIPQLNGYDPTEVTVDGGEYNKETREFYIEKSSELLPDGRIANEINDEHVFEVKVEYPREAIESVGENADFTLNVPVTACYKAYNNLNVCEEGIITSKEESAEITVVCSYPSTQKGEYVYTTSMDKRSLSQRNVLNVYDNAENAINDSYEVSWQVVRVEETEGDSVIVKQNRLDQIGSLQTDAIKNKGIYFSGDITALLGEEGTLKLYNDETNELIKEFTKNDWNTKYYYADEVKFIRIETSNTIKGSYGKLTVNNIKEIDSKSLANSVTRDQLMQYKDIYNYSTAITTGDTLTVLSRMSYISAASIVGLSSDAKPISSQVDENINLKINAGNRSEESWKDGKFLIKIPNQILQVTINKVTTNNSQVEISKYNTYKAEDGCTYIEIETRNEIPINFEIELNMKIVCDPMTKTGHYNIEVYASNPENQIYDLDGRDIDIYDVNNNGDFNDYVAYSKMPINIIAPNNLITLEEIIDDSGNVLAKSPQNLEIDKDELGSSKNVEIKLFNNYSNGNILDTVIVGKVAFKDNTYVIDGGNIGSSYSVSMTSQGIEIPDELKSQVKVYYSEKDKVNKDLNDSNNGWTETPRDFTKIKSYMIDLSSVILKMGDTYSFTYEISVPEGLEYNDNSYSTHAAYFNLETNEGKLPQKVESSKLGILIAKKYNLEITDYKILTEETVEGITYNIIDNEGSTIIATTDENGRITIKNLYVERDYTIIKTNVPSSDYELDEETRIIKVYADGEDMRIENVLGEFRTQEINKEQQLVKLSLNNKQRYVLNLNKIDKNTGERIENIRFLLKGKGLLESGITLESVKDGAIRVAGLYEDEVYTLQEIYAKGYKEITEEIKFKISIENNQYVVHDINNQFSEIYVNNETGSVPQLIATLQNEKENSYTLDLIKYQKDSDQTVPGTKFNLKGKWIAENGEEYVTDKWGGISVELYEGYEYTLKEVEPAEGYVLNDTEIKFIATKNADGSWNFTVTQGAFKEEPKIEGNTVNVRLENEKIFSIVKKDEDTGELLKGVKFVIYEVKRDENGIEQLSEAKDVEGNAIGTEETINGITYRVLETDENGTISERLKPGLYKAIEIEALEGYYLGDLSEHTYYFGIDKSELGDSTITLEYENSEILQRCIIQADDGGYVGVIGNKITKYNSNFEVEWTSNSELFSDESQNYDSSRMEYVQVCKTNGGYIAVAGGNTADGYNIECVLTKYDFNGNIEYDKKLPVEGKIAGAIVTSNNDILISVNPSNDGDQNDGLAYYNNNFATVILRYNYRGDLLWTKTHYFVGSSSGVDYASFIRMMEDNDENILLYQGSGHSQSTNSGIMKLDKEGNRLWYRTLDSLGLENYYNGGTVTSSSDGINASCLDSDGGYIFVGRVDEMNEYGAYSDKQYSDYIGCAIIAKYSKTGDLEWIKTNEEETGYYGIIKLQDGSFVIQGKTKIYKYSKDFEIEAIYDFEKTCLQYYDIKNGDITYKGSVYYSDRSFPSYNFNLLNDNKVIIADDGYSNSYYGEVAPTSILKIDTQSASIPAKQQIIAYNSLKEFYIQTFAGEGGTISGKDEETYEIVKYGQDSNKEIIVTPDEGYVVAGIEVNGSNISFTEESDNTVKIPQFKGVKRNITVCATFVEASKVGEVKVNHYKTGTEEEVAEQEKIRGNVNEPYRTSPKTYISGYSLNVDKLPTNMYGNITEGETTVTYFYDEQPIKVVTHYIDFENNTSIVDDNIQYKNSGEEYATTGLTQEEIPEGYELVNEPENKTGTITGQEEGLEINVYYYYRLKQYTIKTELVNDGGTISGQGKDAYEVVKHGQDATKQIEIIPDNIHNVLNININGTKIEFEQKEDKTVILQPLTNITEDKLITVEFEKIKSNVIIKYIDKKTEEEIEKETVKKGEIGEEYMAVPKDIDGYNLVEPTPENAIGKYEESEIIVKYYYEKEASEPEEPKDPEEPEKPGDPEKPEESEKVEEKSPNIVVEKITNIITNPKTGDYIITAIVVLILTVSINIIIIVKRRKEG